MLRKKQQKQILGADGLRDSSAIDTSFHVLSTNNQSAYERSLNETGTHLNDLSVQPNQSLDVSRVGLPKEEHKNHHIIHDNFKEIIEFTWDADLSSKEIQFSSDYRHAFLFEPNYSFRTMIGNRPFTGGQHYWEIVADSRTEH